MYNLILKLNYPFSYGISPFADEVNSMVLKWAIEIRHIRSDEALEAYKKCNFNGFAARIYPKADKEGLFMASCFLTVLFFFDDSCDRVPVGDKKDYVEGTLEGCMKVLDNKSTSNNDIFLDCFRVTWQWFQERRGKEWQEWFILSMRTYLEACIQEAAKFDNHSYFSLQEYMRLRPYFSGGEVCACLILIAMEINLPQFVYQDKTLKELISLAYAVPSWANDLHSIGKEIKNGDVNNLVLLLKNEKDISLEAAMNEALSIHNKDLNHLMQLEQKLPNFDPKIDKELHRFVSALKALPSGNHEWFLNETSRYNDTVALLSKIGSNE